MRMLLSLIPAWAICSRVLMLKLRYAAGVLNQEKCKTSQFTIAAECDF